MLHCVFADLGLEGDPGGADPSAQAEFSAEYAPFYTAANKRQDHERMEMFSVAS
jgi:hypothetical protein